MATINLITALELIRYNHADSNVGAVLQAAIDELDRLQEIERHAATLAQMVHNGISENALELAMVVSKLAKVE
jgi:hypothetical protein